MSNEQTNQNEINKTSDYCGTDCCEPTTKASQSTKIIQEPTFFVSENDSGISIEVDLPGVNKENTKITSEDNNLTLNATRESSSPPDWNLLNQSHPPTDYKLKLALNPKLNLTKTKATFQKGTLILEVPKKEEALPKQINILN